MKRIGVMFGGKSPEHDISLISASAVLTHIDRSKFTPVLLGITRKGRIISGENVMDYLKGDDSLSVKDADFSDFRNLDSVFPVLHGPNGEDGTIQGMLEMLGLPYVGCNVESSAVNMHKGFMRDVFKAKGFPQPEYLVFNENQHQKSVNFIMDTFSLPVFVKPCRGGSSLGITKVETFANLSDAVYEAFRYDRDVIVEEGFHATEELEVAVLGSSYGNVYVSRPGKLIPGDTFYSYNDKYVDNATQFDIPVKNLPEDIERNIKDLAEKAFRATNCFGLARADFLYNNEKKELVLNEINTMPGFTDISMYPKLMMDSGFSFQSLISELIELSLNRV